MNFHQIKANQPHVVEVLRKYKSLKSLTSAQLATALNAWGSWTFSATLLDSWFNGLAKISDEHEQYIVLFFCYQIYNASTMT